MVHWPLVFAQRDPIERFRLGLLPSLPVLASIVGNLRLVGWMDLVKIRMSGYLRLSILSTLF